MKRFCVSGIIISVIILIISFGLLHVRNTLVVKEEEAMSRVRSANPRILLEVCRGLIIHRESMKSNPVGLQKEVSDLVWVNLSDSNRVERLPLEIANLRPESVAIGGNHVCIQMTHGPRAVALMAFVEGEEGSGSEKLIDGLWILRRADYYERD